MRSSLHYLAILRGDRGHACDDNQNAHDGKGDQHKTVGNGQGEGLLSDLQTQDLARPSGSF
jgi:hypothetical protein